MCVEADEPDQWKEKTGELETSKQEMEKGLLDHSKNIGFVAQASLNSSSFFLLSSQVLRLPVRPSIASRILTFTYPLSLGKV